MAVIKGKLDLEKKDIEQEFDLEIENGKNVKGKIACNFDELLLVKEYILFSAKEQNEFNIEQAEKAFDSILKFDEDYGLNFSGKFKVFAFVMENSELTNEKIKANKKKR